MSTLVTASQQQASVEYEISIEEVQDDENGSEKPMETPRESNKKVKSSTITHVSANSDSQSSFDEAIQLDIVSEYDDIQSTTHQPNTKPHSTNASKERKSYLKNGITCMLISLFIFIYMLILSGTIYYSYYSIGRVSSEFVYFNEELSSTCNTDNGFVYKHPTLNSTLIKTCFSQKIISINSTSETFENLDKLTLFYYSPTTFNIYYFKELSSFESYNSSYYLDPYSVNYWITSNTKYGFKQFALSVVDNSTEIEEKGNYGVRILFQVNFYSVETLSNSSNYVGYDYLTTISESSLEDYIESNSTSFPFTISGSYYVESSMSEVTWLMIGFVLILIFCLIATLSISMRIQRVLYSGEISTFLPLFIRKITINLLTKPSKKLEESVSETKTSQTGAKITYEKLNFKDFSGNTHLYESSGEFHPFTFTAILGESGSGKTTFINTLSRRARGKMGGKVYIGKKQLKSDSQKRLIGFVPQQDIMIHTLTPRETLMFNSFVRNDYLDMDGHRKVVDKVLRDLKLIKEGYDASNTIIGNEEHRGISGGEKKRVNVGIELVTQPAVLILDEPTTVCFFLILLIILINFLFLVNSSMSIVLYS